MNSKFPSSSENVAKVIVRNGESRKNSCTSSDTATKVKSLKIPSTEKTTLKLKLVLYQDSLDWIFRKFHYYTRYQAVKDQSNIAKRREDSKDRGECQMPWRSLIIREIEEKGKKEENANSKFRTKGFQIKNYLLSFICKSTIRNTFHCPILQQVVKKLVHSPRVTSLQSFWFYLIQNIPIYP